MDANLKLLIGFRLNVVSGSDSKSCARIGVDEIDMLQCFFSVSLWFVKTPTESQLKRLFC